LKGYELATNGRYGALALDNFLHFSFGGENINAWKEGHKQALIEAYQAGLSNNPGGRVRAMARNAASNHYLTDAFSSGHMRVPRRPIDNYYRNLMMGAVDGLMNALVEAIPADISFSVPLSQLNEYLPDWLPDIPDIDVDIPLPLRDWVRDATTPIADSLRPLMNEPVGQVLGGLVSKWLHDKENERGLCVSNPAGGIWQAFGDERLDQPGTAGSCPGGNTSNRAEAQKAVAADVAEVNRMFELGRQQAEERDRDNHDNTTSVPSNIHFAFDRPRSEGDVSVLSGADQAGLDALANHLNSNNGVTVNLTGWADSRGSNEYNVGLTSRRISAVRTYLETQGVAANKFGAITPMGEPQVPTTEANHAEFRRVDIELVGTPTPTTPEPAPGEEPVPPGAEGPYDAEQYIPTVTDNNPVLEPYEWCEPEMDTGLKNEVSAKARDMLGGLLRGKITEHLPDNIPVDIEIPVPLIDNPHVEFEIPLRDWLSKINEYIDPAVEAVLTNERFNGILDGACSFAESATPMEE
jgi:outer membrane protein OmpA-like peptidoglycan-associated protein